MPGEILDVMIEEVIHTVISRRQEALQVEEEDIETVGGEWVMRALAFFLFIGGRFSEILQDL